MAFDFAQAERQWGIGMGKPACCFADQIPNPRSG
jgi:hypothetical protein